MSLSRKINDFLLKAKNQNIIDDDNYQKLLTFSQQQLTKSSFLNITSVISFLGSITILLGLFLIITNNWKYIPDLVKFSLFLLTLTGCNYIAFLLRNKHRNLSQTLYFIGSLLVGIGIGLIAIIYNLESHNGLAFLLWLILIIPVAITIKHRWIALLSASLYYIWAIININERSFSTNNSAFFNLVVFGVNMIITPSIINRLRSDIIIFDNLKFIGALIIILSSICMGLFNLNFPKQEIEFSKIALMMFIFNIISLLIIAIIPNKHPKPLINKSFAILYLFLMIIPFLQPIIGSSIILLISWLWWLAFSSSLIYQGAILHSRTLINSGIWSFLAGIILRFIDLAYQEIINGTFVLIFGIMLIIVAFMAEKYRKIFIKKFII
ncbi:MAG: DUF2157 domain-containing protein [Rickettsiales bacterium]|nr:DUF2157 domain-containing protein [Rickettsiales bacterium]